MRLSIAVLLLALVLVPVATVSMAIKVLTRPVRFAGTLGH